jgi:predicted lipoprotein
MLNKRISIIFFLVVSGLLLTQCKKKNGKDDLNPGSSFDKAAMLANIGENIIVPAYADLKLSVDSLDLATDVFIQNPTAVNLQASQTAFINAYIRYQSVSCFEFGPADAELLRANFNIFPCDTPKINSKIIAGDFNFSTVNDIDVKGFPAIDFLLFNSNQNSAVILGRFTNSTNAVNAKGYLKALVNELKQKTNAVNAGWSATGGNYLSTFKNNEGSSVGSSLGLLVNQFNFDFENLKNARIGIPLGKKSLGTPFPTKVEAFYSTQSLALAMAQLKSIENIYLGRDTHNKDGLGFDDYLTALDAQHPLGSLNEVIKNKIAAAKTKLSAIHGTLSEAIKNNPASVDAAYAEIYQLTVLIKVDMPSAFGVMITYEDNDGD